MATTRIFAIVSGKVALPPKQREIKDEVSALPETLGKAVQAEVGKLSADQAVRLSSYVLGEGRDDISFDDLRDIPTISTLEALIIQGLRQGENVQVVLDPSKSPNVKEFLINFPYADKITIVSTEQE